MDRPKLMLFNTMTRNKDIFETQNEVVTFYSCGQTVYDDVHVGNAKTYAAWDILYRVLVHFGYDVKHVQNFTDVGHLTDDADTGDDKIQKKAELLNEHPMELVDRQIQEYQSSMDKVLIHRPNLAPRATSHISEMIEFVEKLIDKGYAYEIEGQPGSFYFDTSKFKSYGKLAKLNVEGQLEGSRDEVKIIEGKRSPSDFALWIKAPSSHIMKYISPKYGSKILGYPGWHLECSVMAMKYLGETIDIHSGGIDHIPVHHTNEIAQSEAATGKPFAKYWLHSEFITVNGEKMSKSKNNFITLSQLIEKVGAGPAKITLIQAHYRTQADFSFEKAEAAKTRYIRLIRIYHFGLQVLSRNNVEKTSTINKNFMEEFNNALSDDLNVPQALVVLNELSKSIEIAIRDEMHNELSSLVTTFETMLHVLGIPYITITNNEIKIIDQMIQHRINLRKEKKFNEADIVRDFLNESGYQLNDITNGTEWYKM